MAGALFITLMGFLINFTVSLYRYAFKVTWLTSIDLLRGLLLARTSVNFGHFKKGVYTVCIICMEIFN